ncbi:MAG: MoaD/ThiS family protein [Anaerolineae bacterium]
MQVPVRFSAGLAQEIGAPRLSIDVPDGATVADLMLQLHAAYPDASRLSTALAVINGQYVSSTATLPPDREVALLLPVSGGI